MSSRRPVSVIVLVLAATACGRLRDTDSPLPTPPATDEVTPDAATPPATDEVTPNDSGTAPTPTLEPGTSHHTLEVDGVDRTYRLDVPDPVPTGPVAVVVALHGGLGSGDGLADITGLDRAVTAGGMIAVFPDGRELRSPLGPRTRTWNAGRCCGSAVREGVDDIAFLDALLDTLAATVELEGVFVTGHSNGAMLAFAYACARASRIDAIAPVAGSLEITGTCAPDAGVDLLAIHGDSDRHHPLEGGRGPRSIVRVDYRSMAETLDLWAGAFACRTPVPPRTDGPLTTSGFDDCRDGTSARLVVVAGADHPWPGGTRPGASDALDATRTVVDFFASLP